MRNVKRGVIRIFVKPFWPVRNMSVCVCAFVSLCGFELFPLILYIEIRIIGSTCITSGLRPNLNVQYLDFRFYLLLRIKTPY